MRREGEMPAGGVLPPNQRLNSGDGLTSGSIRLVMQADGTDQHSIGSTLSTPFVAS